MAHFAKLDATCTVIQVLTGNDDDEDKELELCLRTGDTYRRTSYNTHGGVHTLGDTPFRKNFARVGYIYDVMRDAFIPPRPFPSWTLNETSCLWEAPLTRPSLTDSEIAAGKFYGWNEAAYQSDNTQGWELRSL